MQVTSPKGAQIEVRGVIDQRAVDQLVRCADAGDAPYAAICADGHVGYSQPIGGVIGYPEHISPSGVGYDIGCGNKAVKTNIRANDINFMLPNIMDEIVQRVSFGMGRPNHEPVDHPILDTIANADFIPQRGLAELARNQLGTVGGGNHYVDLFRDEDGWLWVGVHFGSRGFGHKTASGFLALNKGLRFDERAAEGEMDSPPVLFPITSELGESYLTAMKLAGDYAYAGRDTVVDKVCEILGAEQRETIHNHHNYAWQEYHYGQRLWVVRKGATPAWPGQKGFVGATMGEQSVILEGGGDGDAEPLLFSTVHGAGRLMSRTKANGRWKGRGENRHQVKRGVVNWQLVKAELVAQRIELRGGDGDEAPEAYKRLSTVLEAHSDTIDVTHTLTPIGVAMAGPDIYDPFKD